MINVINIPRTANKRDGEETLILRDWRRRSIVEEKHHRNSEGRPPDASQQQVDAIRENLLKTP